MDITEINIPTNVSYFEANSEKKITITAKQMQKTFDESRIPAVLQEKTSLIIINDAQRATPSAAILKLLSSLPNHKIKAIAIATGTHSAPTTDQVRKLTGGIEEKLHIPVIIHDSRAETIEIGTTSRGTVILVNPIVTEVEAIVGINSVEPHYFAGYTGGIKSVIPGLAGLTTVEQNHSWSLSRTSGPGLLDENELQLDLWEAASFLKAELFGIQLVSRASEIYALFAGDLRTAFQQAVKVADSLFIAQSEQHFDVVVSVVEPPLNISLYQAQKGIENTRQILKPGGSMVLLADCTNGIGNTAFYETLKQYSNLEEVISSISRDTYHFGDHKAYKFATLARESEIIIVGELTPSQVKPVFAKALSKVQLEDYLRQKTNEGKSIAIVIDSGTLVVKPQ